MVNKLTLATLGLPLLAAAHGHNEAVHKRISNSGTWYQPRSHPVYDLFGRADGFPDIGTPAWTAGFPPPLPLGLDPTKYAPLEQLKPQWKAALDAAVKAGKIPNVHINDATAAYNPADPKVCSAVPKSCRCPGDIWDAPDGVFASSFDDGPTDASPQLSTFLAQNNVKTTHFLIGTAILQSPNAFKQMIAAGDDLAVHTWTHRQQTTLSNEAVAGELGWTMQLIYNSTGKLPMYWRPPTGDSDLRTSAIAKEVFGMTTVIWNNDSEDWTIGTTQQGAVTQPVSLGNVNKWIQSNPKSPGLMVLEHELNNVTVGIFMSAFPNIAKSGWKFQSLASAYGGSAYQGDVSLFGTINSSSNTTAPSGSKAGSPASSGSTNSTGSTKGNSAPFSAPLSYVTGFAALLLSSSLFLN